MRPIRPGDVVTVAEGPKAGEKCVVKEVLGAGVFVDTEENIHFSIPHMLEAFGWEDTEANRTLAVDLAREVSRDVFPDVPFEER